MEKALFSIVEQTCTDYEVIVCDDGSTDHTKQVVEKFQWKIDLKYVYEKNWGGPARPRNNGIRVARGEWVCFLDSDDWWYPEKLAVVKKYLADGDIFYHNFDAYRPSGQRIVSRINATRHLKKPVFVDLMLNGNALPNFSVVARKSIVEEAGGLAEDKDLVAVEDFDLWLKISLVTDKFVYIPRKLGAVLLDNEESISEFWTERNICRMSALYKKYVHKLDDESRLQADILLEYYCARFKYNIGLSDESLCLFKKTLLKSKRFEVQLKSLFFIAILYCKGIGKTFRF